jgi:hypothetical protein
MSTVKLVARVRHDINNQDWKYADVDLLFLSPSSALLRASQNPQSTDVHTFLSSTCNRWIVISTLVPWRYRKHESISPGPT